MGKAARRRQAEAARHTADVVHGRELVPFLSLDDRAASIRSHLVAAAASEADAKSHRIQAGMELLSVRAILPHGAWLPWCRVNIRRSVRDVQKLLKLAGSADPGAAVEAENARRREGARVVKYATVPHLEAPTPEETPEADVEATAEWLLENMPDGINETLRGVLEPMARLPIARLLDALRILDFEPIPLVKGAFTLAPVELARAA
jgi:hypothetical protein